MTTVRRQWPENPINKFFILVCCCTHFEPRAKQFFFFVFVLFLWAVLLFESWNMKFMRTFNVEILKEFFFLILRNIRHNWIKIVARNLLRTIVEDENMRAHEMCQGREICSSSDFYSHATWNKHNKMLRVVEFVLRKFVYRNFRTFFALFAFWGIKNIKTLLSDENKNTFFDFIRSLSAARRHKKANSLT